MATHEELGKALVDCLKEVASLIEAAQSIATKQQKALVDNDAEGITLTTAAQEEVLRRINETDQRAAALANELAQLAGLDPKTADIKSVSEAAGFPYSLYINDEMSRIADLSGKLRDTNEINAKLLQNGIDIITCCFRTLAGETAPVAYSKDANFSEAQVSILSLDSRV